MPGIKGAGPSCHSVKKFLRMHGDTHGLKSFAPHAKYSSFQRRLESSPPYCYKILDGTGWPDMASPSQPQPALECFNRGLGRRFFGLNRAMRPVSYTHLRAHETR